MDSGNDLPTHRVNHARSSRAQTAAIGIVTTTVGTRNGRPATITPIVGTSERPAVMKARALPCAAIRTAATTHPRAADAIPIPTTSGGSQRTGAVATIGPHI